MPWQRSTCGSATTTCAGSRSTTSPTRRKGSEAPASPGAPATPRDARDAGSWRARLRVEAEPVEDLVHHAAMVVEAEPHQPQVTRGDRRDRGPVVDVVVGGEQLLGVDRQPHVAGD